jgi:hypothetical protein
MWLQICHFFGLTNLSDAQVREYENLMAIQMERRGGAVRQLAYRSLLPVKAIWTILSTRRPVRIVVGPSCCSSGLLGSSCLSYKV